MVISVDYLMMISSFPGMLSPRNLACDVIN